MSVWTRRTHERNAPIAHVLDLLSRIAFGEVDGDATDLFGLAETLGDAINDVYLGRATKNSGVCCHETHRARTKDGDRLARLESGELDTVPTLKIVE